MRIVCLLKCDYPETCGDCKPSCINLPLCNGDFEQVSVLLFEAYGRA